MSAPERYCDYLAALLRNLAAASPTVEFERWQRLRDAALVAVDRYDAERKAELPPGPHTPPTPPWRTQIA